MLNQQSFSNHHTIHILTKEFNNEPAHIFTKNLNSLFLINTQIKHHTHHNNHPDKTMLTSIVKMLQNRIAPISLYKVRAHAKANKLTKSDNKLTGLDPIEPYEFVHSTPFWFCLNKWPSMPRYPYKGPIRFLKEDLNK
jgi:hypothetical protein